MQKCIICSGTDFKILSPIENFKYDAENNYRLAICSRCNIVVTAPFPSSLNIYPENYKPHQIPRTGSTAKQKIMHFIRQACLCRKGYYSFISLLYNKFAYRALPIYGGSTLLDVGCGNGEYLSMMKRLGWKVSGIEVNAKAASFCQQNGLNVKNIQLDEKEPQYPDNHFDVITFWHSLEHLKNPKSVLLKAYNLLNDNGYIIFGLPNYNSYDRVIFKQCWNGFEIPLHLYHFTPATITSLLREAGFSCINLIHTIRPSDTAKSLYNMIQYLQKKPIKENLIANRLLTFFMMPFALLFSIMNHSSIIVIYAKKN